VFDMQGFSNRWGWGRGDRVAHFYVRSRDPSCARSACSTRIDRCFQIGPENALELGYQRCRHCQRSKIAQPARPTDSDRF
jgi:hypothetical protein